MIKKSTHFKICQFGLLLYALNLLYRESSNVSSSSRNLNSISLIVFRNFTFRFSRLNDPWTLLLEASLAVFFTLVLKKTFQLKTLISYVFKDWKNHFYMRILYAMADPSPFLFVQVAVTPLLPHYKAFLSVV